MDMDKVGIYGATRATWRGDRQRERLQRIIDGDPSGGTEKWRDEFWNQVSSSEDDLREIVDYWLDNNLRSLIATNRRASSGDVRRETVASQAAAVRDAVPEVKNKLRKGIHREAQILLMSMIAPNGKTLARCTGADCRRFGGWYSALADAVPPRKCVGDVMSEGEVRKQWLQSKATAA